MSESNKVRSRTYTDEFKQSAIQLALRSPAIKVAAKELGIPAPTLNTWVCQFREGQLSGFVSDSAPSPDANIMDPVALNQLKNNLANLLEETKRLNKKIAVLEEERLILKKAAAYFAREQR